MATVLTVARWTHLTLKGDKIVGRRRYVKGDDLSGVPQDEVDRLIALDAAKEMDPSTTPDQPDVTDTAPEGQDDPGAAGGAGAAGGGAEFDVDTADYDAITKFADEHSITTPDGSRKKKDLIAAIKQYQAEQSA